MITVVIKKLLDVDDFGENMPYVRVTPVLGFRGSEPPKMTGLARERKDGPGYGLWSDNALTFEVSSQATTEASVLMLIQLFSDVNGIPTAYDGESQLSIDLDSADFGGSIVTCPLTIEGVDDMELGQVLLSIYHGDAPPDENAETEQAGAGSGEGSGQGYDGNDNGNGDEENNLTQVDMLEIAEAMEAGDGTMDDMMDDGGGTRISAKRKKRRLKMPPNRRSR